MLVYVMEVAKWGIVVTFEVVAVRQGDGPQGLKMCERRPKKG